MRLVFIGIGVVIAGIFALYCAMGFFDVMWRATANVVVPIVIVFLLLWFSWRIVQRMIP